MLLPPVQALHKSIPAHRRQYPEPTKHNHSRKSKQPSFQDVLQQTLKNQKETKAITFLYTNCNG